MATMTSYLKKTSQVRHVRRWFSNSAQNVQLDTTFKPFGPVRDIFDPWAPGLSPFNTNFKKILRPVSAKAGGDFSMFTGHDKQ